MNRADELKLSASRGARLLDERYPGWADHMVKRLSMASCDQCVVGQLWGDYTIGMEMLFGPQREGLSPYRFAQEYGFDVYPSPSRSRDFAELDCAWIQEIAQRQEAHHG